MHICITLYIFFNTVKAQICTYSKLFDFWYIHIWHIFANVMLLGGCVQNLWLFWDGTFKILKNRISYKIKRLALFLLKFWQNTHFDSGNMLKKLNFKNFQIWTTQKEKLQIFPISLIFGKKFPNRNLLIFFHTWNFLAFKIYICGKFWQNFMVLGSCFQYLWPVWDHILT